MSIFILPADAHGPIRLKARYFNKRNNDKEELINPAHAVLTS